jgi:hypothetical protein
MMVWEMAGASTNKVLFLDNSTLKEDVALLFFSACSGCAGRRRRAIGFDSGVDLLWSSDIFICITLSVASDCQPDQKAIWWLLSPDMISGNLSTSKWRPYMEFVVVLIVDPEPSGVIPSAGEDGHSWSSFHGSGGGPGLGSLVFSKVLHKS